MELTFNNLRISGLYKGNPKLQELRGKEVDLMKNQKK